MNITAKSISWGDNSDETPATKLGLDNELKLVSVKAAEYSVFGFAICKVTCNLDSY